MPGETERIHATAVAVGDSAVLIRGPSGSGKSDIALRCLMFGPSRLLPQSATLVADDQVILTREGAGLVASAPANLRGKLEVRGLGILEVAAAESAHVVLVADLVRDGPIERFLDPWPTVQIMGLAVPLIRLLPFESSAAEKVVAALVAAKLPPIDSQV